MPAKRPRENSESGEEEENLQPNKDLLEMIKNRAPTPVHHYPSTLPFPVVMGDDFPREAYRSRSTDVKTSVHWGQRKLLLSEIQLLCMYCKPDVSYHIVYAGSAPGTHLAFLDDMFSCRHTWELVDPGKFDLAALASRPNFQLRNEFFTNATAYGINARRLQEVLPALGTVYQHCTVDSVRAEKAALHVELEGIVGTLDVARGTEDIPSMYETPLSLPAGLQLLCQVGLERNKPLLFVSDIRSGSVALPNFEDHVAENMRAQECWTMILNGAYSMLKFRLPYTRKAKGFGGKDAVAQTHLIREDGTVPYLRGDMLLPIWTRPTSSEGRLVVPQDAFQKAYHVDQMEDQFFFFNARVREEVHFNHLLCHNSDHHFDNAAEVHCLETYLYFMRPELKEAPVSELRKEIKLTRDRITDSLKITFTDAIRRRDALVLKQAGQGQSGKQAASDDASSFLPVAKEILAQAQKERKRAIWSANIYEPNNKEPSGFWVTTKVQEPTKKS
ncbi:hypothetical protein STCU_03695 [Strigomonas culicis]|uniref:Cap-specific mRNA (nucleoside-2'-O-)-methyltransferase n=1 Tax=Strigomonas culicis TaxID=28005 RepID=S9UQ66_9TRYP|nr:hypothetical protein STCU_03695 [Strigomonas culicis]|eukprot:EPY31008.1 hypothetical protein STCU_03695 [Strigomonas culicis]